MLKGVPSTHPVIMYFPASIWGGKIFIIISVEGGIERNDEQ